MNPTITRCPRSDPYAGSTLLRPSLYFYLHRFCYLLSVKGPKETFRKLMLMLRGREKGSPVPRTQDEVLNLQPGELVEVKSEAEIRATLDERGANRGMIFIDGMEQYCGKQFKVHKRLERMYMEESRQLRRLKNTVLLDSVMCDGAEMRCDRSCYLYWRECWLKRVATQVPQ